MQRFSFCPSVAVKGCGPQFINFIKLIKLIKQVLHAQPRRAITTDGLLG